MFVDTHLHLNDEQYQDDLDEVIARARRAGVGFMLCVGWDIPSSIKAVEIANKYPEVYAAVGVHPENLEGVTLDDLNKLRELAKEPKVIAIGEIGFDFHWYKKEEAYENQKKFFEAQVKLANELNLPISIHAREAAEPTYELLKRVPPKAGAVLHCYSGSKEMITRFLEIPNIYFGFDGPTTFKNAKEPKENVAFVPANRLLSETDSPYLAPVPYRGKRNEPAYVTEIVKNIAVLRGTSDIEISRQIAQNTEKLFHVKLYE